jgi:drug/metabolite transporter (DMT)-like permease
VSNLLALASALAYGTADFLGGFATRSRHVMTVLAVSHGVGLVMIFGLASVLGGRATSSDLVLGAVAGLAGLLGLGFFYWSLAIGTMSVVAPLTAATGAVVPVAVGLGLGERPGMVALLGAALAVVAIVLVGSGDPTLWLENPAAGRRSLVGALVAGIGFGLFFVVLSRVGDEAGLWPLVAARVASVAAIALLLVRWRGTASSGSLVPAALAGVFDMAANAFVLVAFRDGLLMIVSVLAALYPAVTVLLARFVLEERMRRAQLAGLALAVTAVAMISAA